MRLIFRFLLRLGAVAFLAGAIFYILLAEPGRTDDQTIKNHIQDVQNFDLSLQLASNRLQVIASPSVIEPAKKGARDYANRIKETRAAFNTKIPVIPKPIDNQKRNQRLARFNAVIRDPDYHIRVQAAGQALSDVLLFLDHQAVTMLAVANLLEYDPAKDLSSNDAATLAQRLDAADVGLQVTIDRLQAASQYEKDTTLNETIKLISQIQAARDQLAKSVGSAVYDNYKQAFINKVQQVQKTIIDNRTQFWTSESQKLIKLTNEKQIQLNFYLRGLRNI